jgi:uncharacterized protein YbjT (DUF2867 family)
MMNKADTVSNANAPCNVLVVGASGGTGRAAVHQLLAEGHRVTAFSRHASSIFQASENLRPIDGDVMQAEAIDAAVAGQDVVIVTLGISENPLRVRFFGSAATAGNVRSAGTHNVILAMRRHAVSRLVVQSSYGVGETRGCLRFIDKLFFSLLLKPQIADTEAQEQIVRDSGLQWVLVQPVHLTNAGTSADAFVSTEGQTRGMKVSRLSVARFLAHVTLTAGYHGKSVSVSG